MRKLPVLTIASKRLRTRKLFVPATASFACYSGQIKGSRFQKNKGPMLKWARIPAIASARCYREIVLYNWKRARISRELPDIAGVARNCGQNIVLFSDSCCTLIPFALQNKVLSTFSCSCNNTNKQNTTFPQIKCIGLDLLN